MGQLYKVEEYDVEDACDLSMTMGPDSVAKVGLEEIADSPEKGRWQQTNESHSFNTAAADEAIGPADKVDQGVCCWQERPGLTLHTGGAVPVRERQRPLPLATACRCDERKVSDEKVVAPGMPQ